MKNTFLITVGGVLTVLIILVLVLVFRSGDATPTIHLETHAALPGKSDSDGDGVPNWLEEITDSDALNADSFPYNRNVVRARENTENTLLYSGPGEFTEQIIQRFLFDIEGSASVTDKEKERFVNDSVKYFMDTVEKRGLPDVPLAIDNSVSRREVLRRFVSAIQRFSEAKKPIDVLVFDVFAKNASAIEEARDMQESCDYTLKTLSRKVPRDVYTPYYLVLERITYLCEALTVSLNSTAADNFFYILRLVSAGKLFEDSSDNEDINAFITTTQEVVQLLEQ